VEGLAGLLLLLFPSQAVSLLVGTPLEGPSGYVLGRIAAAALLAVGIACWVARDDSKSRAAAGLTLALVFYDAIVVVLLLYVRLVAGDFGLILWPGVVLHLGLGAWSVLCLGRGLPRPVI
jgi:Kef-type K+ transport system membrane component KefB